MTRITNAMPRPKVAIAAFAVAAMFAGILFINGYAGAAIPIADWSANGESSVVNPTTVHLEGVNTSVETGNLNVNVDEGDEFTFRYELLDGAQCVTGAPRVFFIINGSNSQSSNQGGMCGTDGVVTFHAQNAGLITQAGVVYDNGAGGHVLVSDVTIDGEPVLFTEPVDHCAFADSVGQWDSVTRGHIAAHVACRHAAQTGGTVQLLDGNGPTFTDVAADDEHYVAVEYLFDHGVAEGYTGAGGDFGPDDLVRRDQYVSFVARAVDDAAAQGADGLTAAGTLGSDVFDDVNTANVHDGNIGAFHDYALVEGYDETGDTGKPIFGPDRDVIHNHVDLVVDVRWPAEQTPAG